MRDPGQFGGGDLFGEALNAVVRGVDLHQKAGLGGDRLGIVAGVGAVGGADLAQAAAGLFHDRGHAEGAADLDQLAPGDDGLAVAGQRVQDDQHRGGVVVDDGGVLGPGQFAKQAAQVAVAFAAPAGVQIELQRGGGLHGAERGGHGLLRQQGAAEVGVQDGAGQVQDRAQVRAGAGGQRLFGKAEDAGGIGQRLRRRGTDAGQSGAQGLGHGGAAMAVDQGG